MPVFMAKAFQGDRGPRNIRPPRFQHHTPIGGRKIADLLFKIRHWLKVLREVFVMVNGNPEKIRHGKPHSGGPDDCRLGTARP
jgi:hypothetical protein